MHLFSFPLNDLEDKNGLLARLFTKSTQTVRVLRTYDLCYNIISNSRSKPDLLRWPMGYNVYVLVFLVIWKMEHCMEHASSLLISPFYYFVRPFFIIIIQLWQLNALVIKSTFCYFGELHRVRGSNYDWKT